MVCQRINGKKIVTHCYNFFGIGIMEHNYSNRKKIVTTIIFIEKIISDIYNG